MAEAPDGSVRHLLVDARPVDHPTARQRGIGRYVTGLLAGLAAIDAPFTALVGSDSEAEALADVVGDPARLVTWGPDAVRRRAEVGTWYLATQLMLHPVPLDPIPRPVTHARLPVAAIMYDVIPYRHPEQYQAVPAARRLHQLRAPLARTVDALLAISDFAADTAAEELAFPRGRIATIGAGVEARFVPADVDRLPRPDRVLPDGLGDYVVSVTGGDERKNTHGLLHAWARVDPAVRARHRLVIVAAHDAAVARRWRAWAAEAGVAGEVVFTGAVTDDEMVALLQGARLAVMPSLEEGFGLPVLEAVACGTPAICSDVSSLPEVLDEPAACFEPRDPGSIAAAVERGLTDDAHREVLAAAGRRATRRWTWAGVASTTLEELRRLGPRFPGRPRRFPRSIALAGPYEASASGIGPYDARIADALDRQLATRGADRLLRLVDLTGTAASSRPVVASGDAGPTDRAGAPGRGADGRWPARAVGRYVPPWDLDHLVVALGSSHHHVAVAELAARVPCHVWLHEATLVGVHVGLAHLSGSRRWSEEHLRNVIAQDGAGGRTVEPMAEELLDPAWWAGEGLTLLGGVLDRARSVIVSSERALGIVRTVRPDGPPALVLPLAHPDPSEAPMAPGGPPTIVSLGWLDDSKLPEVAVASLVRLRARPGLGEARLVFVGEPVGDIAGRITTLAEKLGVGGAVEITGRLDDESYARRLADAHVGLQLRRSDRGEMSAAITDLAAHGIPTVTNLVTAGRPGPGLTVIGPTDDIRVGADATHDASDRPALVDAVLVDALADALEPLLTDQRFHADAAAGALARARAWTAEHVADALLDWLDRFDPTEHPTPDMVVRAGVSLGADPDRQ